MEIKVTLTPSPELEALVKNLLAGIAAGAAAPAVAGRVPIVIDQGLPADEDKPRRGRKPKAAEAEPSPAVADAVETEVTVAQTVQAQAAAAPVQVAGKAPPPSTPIGLEDVRAVLAKVCKTPDGGNAARAVLAEFGVKKAGELDDDQYSAAFTKLNALLEQPEPAPAASDEDLL